MEPRGLVHRRLVRDIPCAQAKADQAKPALALRKGCVPVLRARLVQAARPQDFRSVQVARDPEGIPVVSLREFRKPNQESPFTRVSLPPPAAGP